MNRLSFKIILLAIASAISTFSYSQCLIVFHGKTYLIDHHIIECEYIEKNFPGIEHCLDLKKANMTPHVASSAYIYKVARQSSTNILISFSNGNTYEIASDKSQNRLNRLLLHKDTSSLSNFKYENGEISDKTISAIANMGNKLTSTTLNLSDGFHEFLSSDGIKLKINIVNKKGLSENYYDSRGKMIPTSTLMKNMLKNSHCIEIRCITFPAPIGIKCIFWTKCVDVINKSISSPSH